MQKSISLILPIYNEPNIDENIDIIDKELANTGLLYEIIAVNDGSDAITTTKLNSVILPHLKTFIYSKNQGKGFALRYGFQHSAGDLICFMDSDLQLHPRQISLFTDLMTLTNTDIVIGSKRHQLSQVEYGPRRKLYSWGYQQLIRMLFDLNVTDTQVGLKMFRRIVLEAVMPRLIVKTWTCDLEILVVAYHLGFTKILEAPIHLDWKPYKSHINWSIAFKMLVETIAIFYRKNFLHYYDHLVEHDDFAGIPILNGFKKEVEETPYISKIKSADVLPISSAASSSTSLYQTPPHPEKYQAQVIQNQSELQTEEKKTSKAALSLPNSGIIFAAGE